LDVIYLYCHAADGKDDPNNKEPYLEFADDAKVVGRIRAADLHDQPPWPHHPLVILNGCGTAGFSAKAVSPFVRKMVWDLGAGGVLGSEVAVWEPLATVFALKFLEAFLSGTPVGDALLQTRRALFSARNPLGLVYILFADADLVLHVQLPRAPVETPVR
jgi:hypothetical protein